MHAPDKFDGAPETNPPYESLNIEDLVQIECDEVLISSWEFQFDIVRQLQAINLTSPIYEIYDNASRSILNVLKGKFPVYLHS